MSDIAELMQFITRTAYKTQETVKTVSSYLADSNSSDIQHLTTLLESLKINSLKCTLEIVTQTEIIEFIENLYTIRNNMEFSDKTYLMLKEKIPHSMPDNLRNMLDANFYGMRRYFLELDHFIKEYSEQSISSPVK